MASICCPARNLCFLWSRKQEVSVQRDWEVGCWNNRNPLQKGRGTASRTRGLEPDLSPALLAVGASSHLVLFLMKSSAPIVWGWGVRPTLVPGCQAPWGLRDSSMLNLWVN